MAHRYLDEGLESASVGETRALVGPEARHAVTVSRAAAGEPIDVGNGAGLVVRGTIRRAEAAELEYTVEEVVEHPRRSPALFLAQALAKADRDELAIQAATELGVDWVIPWAAQRSIARWEGAKVAKGRDRWAAIVREASKQAIRAWIPDVLDLVSTRELARLAAGARMLVLDPTADTGLPALDLDDRDLLVIVGPEGGIAPAELEALVAAGAERVRLGPEVLRTSTAGPAAIAVLSARLGRW